MKKQITAALFSLAVPFSPFQRPAMLPVLLAFFMLLHVPLLAQQKGDRVYDAVTQPAQPKGGISAFQEYVSNNLTYPTLSLRSKTQGIVEVAFIIEKNGSVSNAEIIKGLDEACNQEALRVIKASPKWEPARHQGHVVRQRVSMPVMFSIPSQLATPPALPDSAGEPLLKQVAPEEAARPEGGQEAFFAYIQQNQKYPAKARKNQVQGKVMVEFVVERDGSLSNMKVIKRLGNGLDEEAIRLIEKGPKWLPARFKGEPIRQKMILPVIFQL